ncbi:MAG: hypothetical protein KJN90_11645, partial [Gammaproteobacteria bacterium]|nr:hypothetical protein [Gammaproteobacteria bacterium]
MKKFARSLRPASGLKLLVSLFGAACLVCSGQLVAQSPDSGPWFGLELPPPLQPHVSPAIIGNRGPAPAVVPDGEAGFAELRGERISADLRSIVDFSVQSRVARELGGDQLWGRVSGFASARATIDWTVEQFRQAGIGDIRVQNFSQQSDSQLWLPTEWEVTLL